MVDTTKSPGISYLEYVPNRRAETLLPIIQRVCLPGTIIYSDQFASYLRLAEIGYDHFSVNHSDPEHRFVASDGTNTQAIEAYWSKRKYWVKAMKGIRRNMLPEYLAEFMWMVPYGRP